MRNTLIKNRNKLIYSLDLSLFLVLLISTLQVRELCPFLLQRLQCLALRTLRAGPSPASRSLPSLLAIKSCTSSTIRVFSI
jgi:hypothetical protein